MRIGIFSMLVVLAFLERGELGDDLAVGEEIGLRFRTFGFQPLREGEFPEIARAGGVAVFVGVAAAEREEDRVAAGIGAQALAQKLFGLGDAPETVVQPERADDVGLDALRIELGGEPEPREDFALVTVLAEVRVNGGIKIPAEARDPVFALWAAVIVIATGVAVRALAVVVLTLAVIGGADRI